MKSALPESQSHGRFQLTIGHLLDNSVVCAADQEIVYGDTSRYTYREFSHRVSRLANALLDLGVQPGDTIGVMDWDTSRYLECFFAIPMLGAVLHTINVRLSPQEIVYTINHADDRVLLVHSDFSPILAQMRDHIDHLPLTVLMSDGDSTTESSWPFAAEYEAMLAGQSEHCAYPEFSEDTRATTFYTSGTTGRPKGVYFSHRQLVLHTLGTIAGLARSRGHGQFNGNDVYMPLTPMFHVHAWGIPYLATVLGVKQVYPGRYVAEKIVRLLEREQVTFSHCVPTILQLLLSDPQIEQISLKGWKVVIGGSALPRGLASRALDLGIDIFGGYGLSETGPVLTISHLDLNSLTGRRDRELHLRCKAGRPIPLVELRVVDENMQEVPHDGATVGNIVVRAPWLTEGYLQDAESTTQLWDRGYLRTGDVGHMDEAGYLKVTDRTKDLIKSGGEWISSVLLEDTVSQHPAVGEAAAIGVPDAKWGERPLLLAVKMPGVEATRLEAEIMAHLREQVDAGTLSHWALPNRILLVESLPKTSVGKLDKKLLRQQYSQSPAEAEE